MGFVIRWLSLLATSSFLQALLRRAFVALGIASITYTGVDLAVSALASHLTSSWSGVSGFALTFLTLCKIPQALNLIWSAYVAKLSLAGLTASGKLTRIYWDKDSSIVLN